MPDIRIVPNNAGMAFTSSLNFTETITQTASGSLVVYGSGSLGRTEVFAVDGANGRLFEVTDDLSNSLFSVNTIAGLPVIEAFANNQVVMGSYGNNFGLGIGSNTVVESTSVASSIQLIPSSSYGGGPLIQTGPNGRIRPASTGDRLELEGNALYLNRVFGSSIIAGGVLSMQSNNITMTNTTSTGLQDAAGSAWFRPRDTSNNLHIRTSSGGIYLDTNGTIYFRNVAGTTEAYIDSTNGGGRVMDTILYSNAAAMNQGVATGDSPTFSSLSLNGGLTVNGSLSRGTFTSASTYVSGADNIVLKGNASGVSGIFFESEKDGTNINHPSDFGFIQFHPYGVGGTTGESNRLVIGVSNDADDMIVLNTMDTNGVKVRIGTSATEHTVKHMGNTTYATSFSAVSSVTVTHNLGTKDVMVMVYDNNDEMFWPSSIVTTSVNVVTITFAANRTGRVVVLR